MPTFIYNSITEANSEQEFHLVDLIPCVCRDAERPTVEAQLYWIEEALNAWLRAKITETESPPSAAKDDGMISQGCEEKEVAMSKDGRDILELLRTELDFLEKGGYGRSVRTPWKPTSPFRDSLTCVNYALPEKAHPCSECHLIDFVPQDHLTDELPCHHIPLNAEGDTVEDLEGDQSKLEEALKEWLRAKINEIETASLGAKQDP